MFCEYWIKVLVLCDALKSNMGNGLVFKISGDAFELVTKFIKIILSC